MKISIVAIVGVVAAACVGVLIGTSPTGATPPVIPESSGVPALPPWPAFRLGTTIGRFFGWLAEITTPPDIRALALGTGYWESTITYGLAKSGLLDELPKTCGEAAAARGLDAEFSCRFLRAGDALGLVSIKDDIFSRTPVGEALMNEMFHFVMMANEETREAWWSAATRSLTTGESGFKERFGQEFWSWHAKKGNERQSAQFDNAMQSLSAGSITTILGEYSLPAGDEILCDIGGGRGQLVSGFKDHWPNTTAIVFDLESAASQAVPNVRGVSGSFFESLPESLSKCDVFFLKSVLHDWGDEDSVKILANIKSIAKPTAKLVVFEMVLGEGPPLFKKSHHLLDINMLASNPKGAKERSLREYITLNANAGINSPTKLIPVRGPFSIMETPLS